MRYTIYSKSNGVSAVIKGQAKTIAAFLQRLEKASGQPALEDTIMIDGRELKVLVHLDPLEVETMEIEEEAYP